MTTSSAYEELSKHFKKIHNLSHLSSICGWDQAAMMPAGGNEARSEAMAELAVMIHQQSTAPQLAGLINQAQAENLSSEQQASLAEIDRSWQQANVVPEELVSAKSLAGSKCEHAWRTQRKENDWAGFAKNLKTVVELSREEASIRGQANNCSNYDALMDLYEPGMTSAQLDPIFDDVKSWLPELTLAAQEKQRSDNVIMPTGHFPIASQQQLGLKTMQILGFDFNHGRLDVSTHPFCGGVSSDVRITTRYEEDDFTQSLMGVVHETGHARYEQGLPKALNHLPVGQARSMGIHESQSLLFEMQLGRSKEFLTLLTPEIQKAFSGTDKAIYNPLNLSQCYTRVKPDFIRVDADEVTYPAHVMLRYEIEQALMNGDIEVDDIPELWALKMQQYLGVDTKGNYRNGCMQDVHWTDGSFGYFPSYTLGAMYAAQFMATIKQQMDVPAIITSGDLSPIFNWLKTNIWQNASLLSTNDLVKQATGETLNPAHFKAHLQARYL
ncbi:carboxypeptidase M32 [Moritella sp. 36]|uniref:carboxypeptidase M32 n=1 Tax=Moritella sp. 36 TaxID=2746233 RepID=UPI001BAA9A04|nr:carboxypeptidase M32 [Moritella sp. 36]QUM88125.1 carboxypeptidase M32 [Moritella sp. 36]